MRVETKKEFLPHFSSCSQDYVHDQSSLLHIADGLDINHIELVYGGGPSGTMSVIPKRFGQRGGRVHAINAVQVAKTPRCIGSGKEDQWPTLFERQNALLDHADIVLCLPGGMGTLSELFDLLTRISLGDNNILIIVYNCNGFYDSLQMLLQRHPRWAEIRQHIQVETDLQQIINLIRQSVHSDK